MENGSDCKYDAIKESKGVPQTKLQVCENDETAKPDDDFLEPGKFGAGVCILCGIH